ncbi:MAG: 50S ribosomal protein L7/L12 [Parcubacteria group bacterium]|nr:50S ribosomal protein L7/L12 [Parcubacteria group bacterium]
MSETTTTEKKEVPAKFKSLVEEVSKLSALELSELVHVLEGHFGVSAAAPVAVAAAPAAGTAVAAPVEEKTAFTVELTDAGATKINVIKAIREITQKGLAESKALTEKVPSVVAENLPKEQAEEAKKKLEAAGAKVTLK